MELLPELAYKFGPTLISGGLGVWFGERVIGGRESKQRMREHRQRLYYELADHIAGIHKCAIRGCCEDKKEQLAEEMTAIHMKMQVAGSRRVINAWADYMKYVLEGGRRGNELGYLFQTVGYWMRRDFHGWLFSRRPKRVGTAEATLAIPRRVDEAQRNLAVGSVKSSSLEVDDPDLAIRLDRFGRSRSIPASHQSRPQIPSREW